jgi:hypothetical protein
MRDKKFKTKKCVIKTKDGKFAAFSNFVPHLSYRTIVIMLIANNIKFNLRCSYGTNSFYFTFHLNGMKYKIRLSNHSKCATVEEPIINFHSFIKTVNGGKIYDINIWNSEAYKHVKRELMSELNG